MYVDMWRSCHLLLYSVYLRRAFLILLNNQIQVLYCKLRTEIFLFTYGPSTNRVGHKSLAKKRECVTYSTDQEINVSKIITISMKLIRSTG